jgi:hypothetical protein
MPERFLVGEVRKYYPKSLRLVCYWSEGQQRELVFLTNATKLTALLIVELHKKK